MFHLEGCELLPVRGEVYGVRPVLNEGENLVVDLCVSLQARTGVESHTQLWSAG